MPSVLKKKHLKKNEKRLKINMKKREPKNKQGKQQTHFSLKASLLKYAEIILKTPQLKNGILQKLAKRTMNYKRI